MALIAACVAHAGRRTSRSTRRPALIGTTVDERGATPSRTGASRLARPSSTTLAQQVRRDDAALAHRRRAEPRASGMAQHLRERCSAATARWRSGTTSPSCSRRCSSSRRSTPARASAGSCCRTSASTSGSRSAACQWYPAVLISSALVVAIVGLLPLPGRDRSARRHQLALADLRHLESAARRDRALRGHDGDHQDGQGALRVGHAPAARLARRS